MLDEQTNKRAIMCDNSFIDILILYKLYQYPNHKVELNQDVDILSLQSNVYKLHIHRLAYQSGITKGRQTRSDQYKLRNGQVKRLFKPQIGLWITLIPCGGLSTQQDIPSTTNLQGVRFNLNIYASGNPIFPSTSQQNKTFSRFRYIIHSEPIHYFGILVCLRLERFSNFAFS